MMSRPPFLGVLSWDANSPCSAPGLQLHLCRIWDAEPLLSAAHDAVRGQDPDCNCDEESLPKSILQRTLRGSWTLRERLIWRFIKVVACRSSCTMLPHCNGCLAFSAESLVIHTASLQKVLRTLKGKRKRHAPGHTNTLGTNQSQGQILPDSCANATDRYTKDPKCSESNSTTALHQLVPANLLHQLGTEPAVSWHPVFSTCGSLGGPRFQDMSQT